MPSRTIKKGLEKILDEKRAVRSRLEELLYSCKDENRYAMPIIGIQASEEKDFTFIRELLQGTSSIGAPFVVFWSGKDEVPFEFYELGTVVSTHNQQAKKLVFGCDAMVCLDEKQVRKSFQYGTVPIALASLLQVENYHPNRETGNGFIFESKNPWNVFAAIVRAIETYRFPFDWKQIMKRGLKK